MLLVSAIMPVFNSSRFLRDAIESVAHQKYPRIELLIIDDGSTDDTKAVAQTLLNEFRLEGAVFSRPNSVPKGPGACRNFGVSKARGDIVAFIDSDDAWLTHHVVSAVDVLESSEHMVSVYSSIGESRFGDETRTVPEGGFPCYGVCDALPLLLSGMFIPTVTLCVHTSAFRRTSGFSETLSCYEDWWLVLQLSQLSRFYFSDISGCEIRQRRDSLTRSNTDRRGTVGMSGPMYRDQLRLLVEARDRRLLARQDLDQLRRNVIDWNRKQLSDHACAFHFRQSAEIGRYLFSAGPRASLIIGTILTQVSTDVISRGYKKIVKSKPV